MHICHVITRLIVGGAQENTILTCEGLRERGHQVTLISGPTTGPEGSLVDRARSRSTILMVPYSPEGMTCISDQIMQALPTSNDAQKLDAAIDRAAAAKSATT